MKIIMMVLNILRIYNNVVWENTEIYIPLNSDTYQYYDMPKAKLVDKNGNLVEEGTYYEKGVNHTSLNVINSRHVRTFKIDYRVHFDRSGESRTQTIYFNIVDITAPVFIHIPEISRPVNDKVLTEKVIIENLIYNDNYYEKDQLIVKVNGLASVNEKIPGIYKLEYEIMDPSFNVTKQIGYYIVENNLKPKITYKDLITINYGEPFNYINHFKFSDEYDKNLKIEVDESKINFNKLGTYPIEVTATNYVGLFERVTATIEIVDKKAPKLVVRENNILNVYNYNYDYLKDIILDVSDNYDNLTIDDVIIEGYVDFDIVNKYELTYIITDSSNNTTSKKVIIDIKDLTKPRIELKKELIFNIKGEKPNWYNYFDFFDNYDDFNDLTINFNEKNINFNNLGTQILEVSVTDLSKNKLTNIFEIKVLDLIAPNVIQMEELIITDFASKNNEFYKSFFAISDNYDSYNDIEIDVNNFVDYSSVGEYEVDINFIDTSNNITKVNTIIYVLDIIKPTITLTTNVYYYYINNDKLNLNDYILNVNDNKTTNDNLELHITDNIDYYNIGIYEVIYELYDESNNMNSAILKVYVDKTKSKLINGETIYLNINSIYTQGSNLILSDEVVKVVSFPNHIDTTSAKTTEVLHIAYDIRGNYEEYLQTVHIINDEKIQQYKNNIIVTVIGVIIIVTYYLYERKNNNNF